MKAILAIAIGITLTTSDGWEELKFNNIPANQVEFSKEGLKVKVKNSAGPLIYPLKEAILLKRAEAAGEITSGDLKLKNPKKQGLKGEDDFVFRLGLVVEGKKKLNWLQRQFAPQWVKRLHEIAPKGTGVDHILFLEVANDFSLIGTERIHYLSEYIKEKIVASVDKDKKFVINYTFAEPIKVIGIWLSIDGDISKSEYEMTLKNLTLHGMP